MPEKNGNFRPRRPANRPPRRDNPPKQPAANPRDVALAALCEVTEKGAYASQAIDRQISCVHLSPEDRRLATSIFYAAVENRLTLDCVMAPFIKAAPDPVIREILHIACAQILCLDRIPDHAAVDEAVKQARRKKGQSVTGFVNAVLRGVLRARDEGTLARPETEDPIQRMSVTYSVSRDLAQVLCDAYGPEEAEKICAFRSKEHTQTVRPNSMSCTPAELEKYLTAQGISFTPGAVPDSYRCTRPGALAALDGYRRGLYSLQGESSILAARAMEARPGMTVLDACAAPGGKSAYMCEAMNGTGRVYAWDVHGHRVDLIRAAGKRLRLYNLRPSEHDARKPYEAFDLLMNAVLVDAPCSGLGVLADKPDIRLHFSKGELAELLPLQKEILANCARFVKVGGLLVYSTCTILPEENQRQVEAFLRENPQFAPDTGDDWLPERFRPLWKDGMLQLLQHRDGVEGFFIARMRRKCL